MTRRQRLKVAVFRPVAQQRGHYSCALHRNAARRGLRGAVEGLRRGERHAAYYADGSARHESTRARSTEKRTKLGCSARRKPRLRSVHCTYWKWLQGLLTVQWERFVPCLNGADRDRFHYLQRSGRRARPGPSERLLARCASRSAPAECTVSRHSAHVCDARH